MTGEWRLAPVFDCGSSLYPQADPALRRKIMTDPAELNTRINNRPLSVFKVNGTKVTYNFLLQSGLSEVLDEQVIQMGSTIGERLPEILDFIESSPLKKEDVSFYKFILEKRKERIIDLSMRMIDKLPRKKRLERFHEAYGLSKNGKTF